MKFIILLKNCLFLIFLLSVGMTIITAHPQQSKPNKASTSSALESKSDREKNEAAQQLLTQRAHDEKIRIYLTILAISTIIGSITAGVWLLKNSHNNAPQIDAQPIRNNGVPIDEAPQGDIHNTEINHAQERIWNSYF